MTKTKGTLRALLMSALALLMCVSMLIGSTFAWFTDEVVSGNNVIKSGNLDVELYHSSYSTSVADADAKGIIPNGFGFYGTETDAYRVESDTKLFLNEEGKEILWEPGAIAVETFRIKNEGSLALKYQFKIDFYNATETPAGKTLADIINISADALAYTENGVSYGVSGEAAELADRKLCDGEYIFEGHLLPGEDYDFWVGLQWVSSEIDNEFNVKEGLSIDFGVTLLATQYTYEKDSYNSDQYDKDATYPEFVRVTSAAELQTAINNGETEIYLTAGTYDMPNFKGLNGVKFVGESRDGVIIKLYNQNTSSGDFCLEESIATLENMTIVTEIKDWAGFQNAENLTFNGCKFINNLFVTGNATFNNCEFEVTTNHYNVWTFKDIHDDYVVEFNRCVFNCTGKSIYVDGNEGKCITLKINKCIFNDNDGGANDKAAIETGKTYGWNYDIRIDESTFNGFAVNPNGLTTNSTIWANKASLTTDQLNVVIDGVDVY